MRIRIDFVAAILAVMSWISAHATPSRTLCLFDIDDTTRVTQLKAGFLKVLRQTFIRYEAFPGMPEILNALQENGDLVEPVTVTPTILRWSHRRFFKLNGIQVTSLVTRNNPLTSQKKFKLNRLRSRISEARAAGIKKVLVFGDDGQEDWLLFDQVIQEFPDMDISAFIHRFYGRQGPANPKIQSYATSADLAPMLFQQGQLTWSQVKSVLSGELKAMQSPAFRKAMIDNLKPADIQSRLELAEMAGFEPEVQELIRSVSNAQRASLGQRRNFMNCEELLPLLSGQ